MSKDKEKVPNIVDNPQVVADARTQSLENFREKNNLDEETEYYARVFLEL